ncbi:hypothetical protein SDC9_07615 [bioreactor metagenome]|uniref:Uncharacterized protein n=1 Tax=bioreactor metagenome TaxID=1076179 RepID=A0A644T515_9ZZZZ|nr:hypothetical protein [Methanobrevibacter sp.]MEA4957736.1 hypothetical protein [Methanobrevibacter sp.]
MNNNCKISDDVNIEDSLSGKQISDLDVEKKIYSQFYETSEDNEYIEMLLNWIEVEERKEYQFFIAMGLI